MSALLQICIAYAVSIIWFLILWFKILSKADDKISVYVITAVAYVAPYALAALFIGKVGFFFSDEYIFKNIFFLIAVENIIIAFMQAMWLENTLSFVKNIKARKTLLIAIAVICSIWWAIASNYYINNTDVETNTATESVKEELYWNESN